MSAIAEGELFYGYDNWYRDICAIFADGGLHHLLARQAEGTGKKTGWAYTGHFFRAALAYCALLAVWGQELAESLIVPVEMGLCLILIVLCSADRWPVSIFVMFSQFNLYLGISYLADVWATEATPLAYNLQYLLYRTVLFGALLFFNFKILRPRFRKLVKLLAKEWRFIAFVAFAFYALEAVILYVPRFYWYEPDYRWYLVASSYLVFFGVYWLIFQSINAIAAKYEGQERERILAQQNKLWEEQLAEQKAAVSAARHDLRHHFDTLLAMLVGGKTQEALSYLNAQTQRGGRNACRCLRASGGECHFIQMGGAGKGERHPNRSRCGHSRKPPAGRSRSGWDACQFL